ncbi:Transcription termination factor mterf9, chloroplastic [Stylosanthes scabra]|uniref:Transcription termination factor mterf9, chloroplastic n=1 Tax=Stylosanthes scabra TaxID=79078 RepID=A0ABU6TM79_9FABA|nr:Transcription termination factor mterf9, chloroplastic [Stylosanthes scabra]
MVSIFSLYPYNPLLYSSSYVRNFLECHFSSNSASSSFDGRGGGGGGVGGGGSKVLLLVAAAHSNPNILKTNRKSKYGYPLSTYDSDDDDDDDDDEDDDGDWLSDEEFAEPAPLDTNGKRSKLHAMKGKERQNEKEWDIRDFDSEPRTRIRGRSKGVASLRKNYNRKLDNLKEKKYPRLSEEIILDSRWLPLLDYLSTFGIKESHFIQMYQRHMPSLQINVCSAQERLDYLMSVGVKHRDVRRILVRQPQILGYTVENNLKSHVAFLTGLGIPSSRVGQIIAAAPSLFSYSVENSLKPTVRYLVEQVGIKERDLGKVIQLSPQILVQRIDVSWNTRYMFLMKELGAPKDSVVKMVTKHPQLLHYSIDDGLLPRINFLRSIGMKNSDILKVLTSLTQVLSLSLEDNLKPKYLYLVNELNNEVQSLTKYPMYLSLSLDQRIRPRHRFLVSLKKAPKGPFPLGSLVPTDECFCQQWAGTSVDKYLAFRQRLLVRKFAEKFQSKM